MNTSRKSHRKTRTGCGLCKKRKIKCDEQKPQCKNCIKHSVQCDFLVQQPGQHNSPGNQSSGHHQSPSGALDMSMPPILNAQPESLNLMDLELLHNFTTSTFSTLSFDPLLRNLWRLNVAQIGFQYGFVMRGILAVSALHLAYYHPAKRDFYLAVGMNQHQTALRVGISMVSNVTQENCSAIYIFSVLTFYFTLASPRKPGNFLLMGDSGISDWLYLLRGTVIIVENNAEYLTQGPLGPMFEFGRRRVENREGVPGLNEVQELKQFIRSSSTDPQHLEIYLASIEELDRSLALLYNGGIQNVETAHIFTWAMRMSEEYLLLLREGAQEALAIFAFSCVLLKYLDCHWWMDGWSTHLISKTYYMLDEEHRLWVRWPVEEIGWIPMQDEISHHNGAQTHPSQIHPALGGTS